MILNVTNNIKKYRYVMLKEKDFKSYWKYAEKIKNPMQNKLLFSDIKCLY